MRCASAASSRSTRRTSATSIVEEGQPLTFTASFDTVPPFEPGDYATIALRRAGEPRSTTRRSTQALQRLRDRAARLRAGRRPRRRSTATRSDRSDLRRRTGTPTAAARTRHATTDRQNVGRLGATANPPGFDEQLLGLEAGATEDVRDRTIRPTTRSRSWRAPTVDVYGDGQGDRSGASAGARRRVRQGPGRVRLARRAARRGCARISSTRRGTRRSARCARELMKQLAARVPFEVPPSLRRARDRSAGRGLRAPADRSEDRPATGGHRLGRVPREPARGRAEAVARRAGARRSGAARAARR